jgi:hypothetical protein
MKNSSFKTQVSGFLCLVYIIFLSLIVVSGCSPRFSSLLSETWSENYALASYGAVASNPRINDGDMGTWGDVHPPDRVYTIALPEQKKLNRIVIYSHNVIAYRLFCWDSKAGKWKLVGSVGSAKGRQRVYSDRHRLDIPRFDHRINFKTNKIKLQVTRAESDGVVTTRTPGKNVKILNHRVDYIGTGRNRRRLDLYDVFVEGFATIREIEAYSHVEKPVIK